MKKKQVLTLILTIITSFVYGQNKKELNETINKLRVDSTALELSIEENTLISTALELTIEENTLMISSLNKEILDSKELNTVLHEKNQIQLLEFQKIEELMKESQSVNTLLYDSIGKLQKSVDSIKAYSHITRFVQAFYNSLELSKEENQRQYEVGDVNFDLGNFSSLIDKNANYSEKRVDNLSDESYHDRYYIELLSIEEIKFVNDKIIVRTKVMYAGSEMGSFYNEERLTLQDNKGLLKLTSWLDVDLYKMEPSEYEHMENFTKDDFYKWLGSFNKN
tara:strand:+ start:62 stop:898 length:837 start_codon:yes stop_codon:yes gene_type:complete